MPVADDSNVIPIVAQRGRKIGKLTVLSDIDAKSSAPRDYYLKSLISPAEMSVIYGEPGCGKSFFVLYIVRAIAQERQVLGLRVHPTNILFLALEGIAGFEKRLKAEIERHEESEGFFYIAQPVDLFQDHQAVKDVIAATEMTGAGIVVIDTMNRALAGGSENDPGEMGHFIKNIDAIRSQTGAHVIIIHHSGKDDSRGPRGHSSLLGAADLVLKVSRVEQTAHRTVKIIKSKDDADGADFNFILEVKELGKDIDDEPITTCIVIEDDAQTPSKSKPEKFSQFELLVLSELVEMINRGFMVQDIVPDKKIRVTKKCVTRDDFRDWGVTRGLLSVTESVTKNPTITGTDRTKLSRALQTLKQKDKICIHGDWIWING